MLSKRIVSRTLFSFAVLAFTTTTTLAQFSFGPANSYSTGQYPSFVTTSDFDNDGKRDLVTSNSDANTVSVLLGNGNGTFQSAIHTSVGNRPVWLGVGDFNVDGKPDVAVTHYFGNDVGVLLGNGNGTFQTPVYYSTGNFAYSVAVGDVDNDTKLDLVVVNYTCFQCASSFSVLLGNGNGTFQNAVNSATGGSGSQSHELGDLNGDGKLDLVVSSADDNSVNVRLGNGDGSFQPVVNYSTGPNPVVVTLGDFNGDALRDFAVTTYFDNQVSVRLGNGNGTFQGALSSNCGANPGQVIANDFDSDGKADLAVANITSDATSFLLGNGNGTFQLPNTYSVGPSPFSLHAADFNGDGKPDLAVANRNSNNISVLLNTTAPQYSVGLLYDDSKAHKRGSTIPIKIQVLQNNANVSRGLIVVNAVGLSIASHNAPGLEVDDSGNANPDHNFRFDPNLDGYIFNLKTTELSSNTTYKLYFTIGDSPLLYSVTFQVK